LRISTRVKARRLVLRLGSLGDDGRPRAPVGFAGGRALVVVSQAGRGCGRIPALGGSLTGFLLMLWCAKHGSWQGTGKEGGTATSLIRGPSTRPWPRPPRCPSRGGFCASPGRRVRQPAYPSPDRFIARKCRTIGGEFAGKFSSFRQKVEVAAPHYRGTTNREFPGWGKHTDHVTHPVRAGYPRLAFASFPEGPPQGCVAPLLALGLVHPGGDGRRRRRPIGTGQFAVSTGSSRRDSTGPDACQRTPRT